MKVAFAGWASGGAIMAPQLEELALRLHAGARAIREGRVNATIAELVTGALESVHAEAAAQRRAERLEERAAQGLCPRCGRMPITPGRKWCAMCLLRERVRKARRRGKIPHIRHPRPKEEAS